MKEMEIVGNEGTRRGIDRRREWMGIRPGRMCTLHLDQPPHLSVSGRKGKTRVSEKVFEAETAMESGLFWCGIEHIAETHSSDCC